MAQLLKKTQYALAALYVLARRYGDGPILVQEISDAASVPKLFLQEILRPLKACGVVASRRGRSGGYLLSKHPRSVTVGAVVRILEGSLLQTTCAGGARPRRCRDCADPDLCIAGIVMRTISDAVTGVLDRVSLEEACRRADESIHHKVS